VSNVIGAGERSVVPRDPSCTAALNQACQFNRQTHEFRNSPVAIAEMKRSAAKNVAQMPQQQVIANIFPCDILIAQTFRDRFELDQQTGHEVCSQ
jgi:hypothetical protein